jgi:hypothetical protein
VIQNSDRCSYLDFVGLERFRKASVICCIIFVRLIAASLSDVVKSEMMSDAPHAIR